MTIHQFITSCELWVRLAMLILGPLREALLAALHNTSNGLPKSPKDLFTFLTCTAYKTHLIDLHKGEKMIKGKKVKTKKVITQPQWELLYPSGKTETNSTLFDITLIVLLIEVFEVGDVSIRSFCKQARDMRNYLNHFSDISQLAEPEFSTKWNDVKRIVKHLNYVGFLNVNEMKTISLDPKNNLVLRSRVLYLSIVQEKLSDKVGELSSSHHGHEFRIAAVENLMHASLTKEEMKDSLEQLRIELVSYSNVRGDMEQKIENLDILHKQFDEQISFLEWNIEGIKSDAAKNMESIRKRTTIFETNLNEVRSKTSSLESSMDNISGWTSLFEADLTDVCRRASSLESRVDSIRKQFSNLRSSVDDVRTRSTVVNNDIRKTSMVERDVEVFRDFSNGEQSVDYDEFTSLAALDIVTKMIGDDWMSFSRRLDIEPDSSQEILNKDINESFFKFVKRKFTSKNRKSRLQRSNETNMKICFEMAQMKINWKDLKFQLEMMDRFDIIEKIYKNTCLTKGLEKNSERMKKQYKKTLKNWNTSAAFRSIEKHTTNDRKDAYVDLMVEEWNETYPTDPYHFLKPNQCKRRIEMPDIIQPEDQIILLRGMAGVGKTSLINRLVLGWASNEFLKNFDFVIKYTCRELNGCMDIYSWHDLITNKFPVWYDGMLDDLDDISEKILLIIDGLDELEFLSKFSPFSSKHFNLASVFFDLLGESALRNKKLVLCGRPQFCDKVRSILTSQNRKLKLVEVTGFNDISMNIYIDRFFGKTDIQPHHLKTTLLDNDNLRAMAHIPIYLYIICSVFSSEEKLYELNTITKLNIAACLVYLRDHMTEFKGKNIPLGLLCKEKSVAQVLRVTAKFAYKSLMEGNTVFKDDDFKDISCLKPIESSGMIEKFEGDEDGDIYQFTQFVLLQFLSAVHIFIKKLNISKWRNLKNCAAIVAGFFGISQDWHQGPKYIKTFVEVICAARSSGEVKAAIQCFSPNTTRFLLEHYECGGDILLSSLPKESYEIKYHHILDHLLHYFKNCDTNAQNLKVRIQMDDRRLHSYELCSLSSILHLFASFFLTIEYTSVTTDGLHSLSQNIMKHASKKSSESDTDKKVIHLSMHNCHLNDHHINELRRCIPFLKKLQLSENDNMTEQSMMYISNAVVEASERVRCNVLAELDIRNNKLNDSGIEELCKCIPFLEKLNISKNENMTEQSMMCVSKVIVEASGRNCNMLKELHICESKLNDGHIRQLRKCIPLLRKLSLSKNCYMTERSMKYLSKAIVKAKGQKCFVLEELRLRECELTDNHIRKLNKCIPILKKLSLAKNPGMTEQSMAYISNSIVEASKRKCNLLEELDLSECNLTSDHIKQCIPYLKIVTLKITSI